MTYKRMTEADRRHIHRWRQEGDGAARDCSALGVCDEQHQQGAFPQHRRPGLPSKAGAREGAKAGSAAGAASVHG